ncbi:hypothetical protein CsSME_00052910 [Camellia sinensis var. sinensis]
MASFTSSVTSSTWPRRMCACGHGSCIVKISRSTKNPGCPYFACPRPVVSAQFITIMASICTSTRTQSKSKGIVTEKSSSLEETQTQFSHKASWDNDSIRVFLQLIANEIAKGNRPFLVLSQAGKGVSGIGFDCDTGMFQAPEEWWDKMESVNACPSVALEKF